MFVKKLSLFISFAFIFSSGFLWLLPAASAFSVTISVRSVIDGSKLLEADADFEGAAYRWEKQTADGWITVGEEKYLSVREESESGTYRVTVTDASGESIVSAPAEVSVGGFTPAPPDDKKEKPESGLWWLWLLAAVIPVLFAAATIFISTLRRGRKSKAETDKNE